MSSIIPTILILASIGLFFGFTNPLYKGSGVETEDLSEKSVTELRLKEKEYADALKNANAILEKRDELEEQHKKFSKEDLNKIKILLPDNIDNVQLLLDLNGIAKKYAMILREIKIEEGSNQDSGVIGEVEEELQDVTLSFSVSSSYENFQKFLQEVESSLRIVDVTALSFKSDDKGIYEFETTIKTYWLAK